MIIGDDILKQFNIEKESQSKPVEKKKYDKPSQYKKDGEKILESKGYADMAENVIYDKEKKELRFFNLTTSKLRKLLAMSSGIYNYVLNQDECDKDELLSKIIYFKMKCIYECGRECKDKQDFNKFMKFAKIVKALEYIIDNKDTIDIREEYILFNRYMESLIAYHKYHGGREQ